MSTMVLSGDAHTPTNRNPLTVEWSALDEMYKCAISSIDKKTAALRSLNKDNVKTADKLVNGVVTTLNSYVAKLNNIKNTYSGMTGTITSADDHYLDYINVNAKYNDIMASIDVVYSEGANSINTLISNSKGM